MYSMLRPPPRYKSIPVAFLRFLNHGYAEIHLYISYPLGYCFKSVIVLVAENKSLEQATSIRYYLCPIIKLAFAKKAKIVQKSEI